MPPDEARAVQRAVKASSERADGVKRARAVLAVRTGPSYTRAAREAGYRSGDSVSQLVERFNQQGLAALHSASGRGRQATYSRAQRERILAEVQRSPDRTNAATATWSLKTLERALHPVDLPHIGASPIRVVWQEAGYRYTTTRTWCATGTALRMRAGEPVTVHDPKTEQQTP
jgi:transposase